MMKKRAKIHISLILTAVMILAAIAVPASSVLAVRVPYGSVSTGSVSDEKIIWDYFMIEFGNAYGVAGLMGNLYAESELRSGNLQDSYEKSLGYTDETYTKAVDEGRYSRFSSDSAGYGLAQWTSSTRKQKLLDFVRGMNVSVSDFGAQLDFLKNELNTSYPSVVSALKSASSVRYASTTVLKKFESPADQSYSVQNTRASYSQAYYNKYKNTVVDTSVDTTGPSISEITVSDVTSYGFTLSFTATDDTAVSRAEVKIWTEKNGSDDIKTYSAVRSGNAFTVFIDTGDHNSESGVYKAYIDAYDVCGNHTGKDGPDITVPYAGAGTVIVTSKIYFTAVNGDQWTDTGAYLWTEGTFKAVWWQVMTAVKSGKNYVVTAVYECGKQKTVTVPSGGVLIAVHANDANYDAASKVKKGDNFVLFGISGTSMSAGAYAGFGELKPESRELIPRSSSSVRIGQNNVMSNVPKGLSVSAFFAEFEENTNTKKVYGVNNAELAGGFVGTGCTVKIFDEGGKQINSYTVVVTGDLDGDGKITSSDYIAVKALLKSAAVTADGIRSKAADVTGDGRYTTSDYVAVKRYVAGRYSF